MGARHYGQERPSATANGTEKFTGYFRDSATGLDYADQRYHQPGVGRFMTPDPYGGSAGLTDPGSWNRYAYVGGDPINFTDHSGLQREGAVDIFPLPHFYGPPGPSGYANPNNHRCYDGTEWYITSDDGCGFDELNQRNGNGRGPGSGDYVAAVIKMLEAKAKIKSNKLDSEDCTNSLAAVGLTPEQAIAGVESANILNGYFNQANYANQIFGHTDAWSAARGQFRDMTIGMIFALNGGTVAIAQAFGHDIYIDPTWVNSFSGTDTAALLLHEVIHNLTGKVDSTVQDQLGLPQSTNSRNIADKLARDCFK